jgi:hypothetical protein
MDMFQTIDKPRRKMDVIKRRGPVLAAVKVEDFGRGTAGTDMHGIAAKNKIAGIAAPMEGDLTPQAGKCRLDQRFRKTQPAIIAKSRTGGGGKIDHLRRGLGNAGARQQRKRGFMNPLQCALVEKPQPATDRCQHRCGGSRWRRGLAAPPSPLAVCDVAV